MTSELIERMAKAIDPNSFDPVFVHTSECDECEWHRNEARRKAKAALKAAREPTEKIKNVVTGSIYYSAEEIWQAMIDKELEE